MYWNAKDPILKIPNLAIHLGDRSGKFEPNNESHLKPVLATSIIDSLFSDDIESLEEDKYSTEHKHFKTLLNKISSDLEINTSDIVDFELNLIDY